MTIYLLIASPSLRGRVKSWRGCSRPWRASEGVEGDAVASLIIPLVDRRRHQRDDRRDAHFVLMAHLRRPRTVMVRQCPIAEWHPPNFLKSNCYAWPEPCIAPEGISQLEGLPLNRRLTAIVLFVAAEATCPTSAFAEDFAMIIPMRRWHLLCDGPLRGYDLWGTDGRHRLGVYEHS